MGQVVVGNHNNKQEIYDPLESLENRQRKHNIRLKNVKKKVEGANLQSYIIDLWESTVGVEGEGKLKIEAAFRVAQYKKNMSRPASDIVVQFSDWA